MDELSRTRSNGLGRTKSNGPGHLMLDRATTGTFSEGTFKIRFHDDIHKLTKWVHGLQTSFRKPTYSKSSGSSGSTTIVPDEAQAANLPRMNIAIHIVGSRGDVQPFIPVAQMLSKEPFNHRVRICTHPVFKDFVEEQGVEFFSIGGDPEALMAYMVKNPGLLPNRESVKAGDVGKRREEMWQIMNGCWRSCIEAGNGMGERITAANVRNGKDLFLADAIIANPPSMAHIHCAEKLGIPLHMVFTMPWSPTETFSHPLAAMNYGDADAKTANYLSFVMMEMLTWQGLGDLISKFRRKTLRLDAVSPMWGFQLLSRLHVPFTYLWSQALIPKPADWGSYIDIAGFSFLPLASSYTPPDDLAAFLKKGDPPVYIGFGSIVVDDPEGLTRLIFEAVNKAGVRAIISKGWSGITGSDETPEDVYFIGNCPHDWLFQRMSAVVHHGGAGTTAAGIAAGKPTVVVPFFGDQPFWGQMIARAGAGPKPITFKEMTADSLAESIKFALKPDVLEAAQKMAENIAKEDGATVATEIFLERLAGEGRMQCEICPDRLAHWKHKRTGHHLSGFAAICLIDKGIIQPHDIKLLHAKKWYVDEGAEHPLVGAVASITQYVTILATATSDYAHALGQHPVPSNPSKTSHPPSPPAQDPGEGRTSEEANAEADRLEAIRHRSRHPGLLKTVMEKDSYTPAQFEALALKMATKSLHGIDHPHNLVRRSTMHDKSKEAWRRHEQGKHGRGYFIARATGRYASEVTKATLKAPVAFFWNTANGFHNFPSYGFAGVQVRRRKPITGLGSGLKVAGNEFVLGFWEAFSGIVMEPYKGTKAEGAKGFGKGIWRAGKSFFFNTGAAIWGLPGYSLKGVEKALSKRQLTKLKAEIMLIRIRQSIIKFKESTPEQRDEVEKRWAQLCRGKSFEKSSEKK